MRTGFTLLEVLATTVLIAAIMAASFPWIQAMLRTHRHEALDRQAELAWWNSVATLRMDLMQSVPPDASVMPSQDHVVNLWTSHAAERGEEGDHRVRWNIRDLPGQRSRITREATGLAPARILADLPGTLRWFRYEGRLGLIWRQGEGQERAWWCPWGGNG